MITRRRIVQVLAGSAIAAEKGFAHMPSANATASAGSVRRNKVQFTAYGFPYDWHPIPALGSWPLDHISVATSTDTQWGCFGRTYAADPRNATVVARGWGDELWAKAIAGPDGNAGVENGVSGVCDHCANRILLPTGIDVRNSPGNEIAVLFCGVYGFDTAALVQRVEAAASAVNRDHPGRVPDADVAKAVAKVTGGLKAEWHIVRANNERILKPVLSERYDALQSDVEAVYLSFYYRRTALYQAFSRGHFDKKAFVTKVRNAFSQSLGDLKDVMGAEAYSRIVPVPPPRISEYIEYKTNDKMR